MSVRAHFVFLSSGQALRMFLEVTDSLRKVAVVHEIVFKLLLEILESNSELIPHQCS